MFKDECDACGGPHDITLCPHFPDPIEEECC